MRRSMLVFGLLMLLASVGHLCAQQQLEVEPGDSLVIKTSEVRGAVEWETSPQGNTWQSMTGETRQTLKRKIDVLPVWYRAKVTDGTCAPLYSTTVEVKLRPQGLPTVITGNVSAISTNAASVVVEVTSAGSSTLTAKGVVYSTSSGPTVTDNKVEVAPTNGPASASLVNLASSTTYYVRGFATNASGTSYGSERSFTTNALTGNAVVATSAILTIQSNSASISINVVSDGGAPVTARGVVYATSSSPTLSNNSVSAGTGLGSATANLTNLLPLTRYFARAYATNTTGTIYGTEISFTTPAAPGSNTILMFLSHEETYYSEYIVARRAFESAGYTVDARSATAQNVAAYMTPYSDIPNVSASLPGGSQSQFETQFSSLFGVSWNASDNAILQTIPVLGSILDVMDMSGYKGFVVAGGLGALAYLRDGQYTSQGTGTRAIDAAKVQQVAEHLNIIAISALNSGKPVLAQCHAAALPVYWRVPNTSGPGVESIGFSLLKGQRASGFPDAETQQSFTSLGVNYLSSSRVTISSPNESLNDEGKGDFKIITSRDWFPQTVASAARALLNVIESYPPVGSITNEVKVAILHGGGVDVGNCTASNRANDVPCNYGNTVAELPADYNDLVSLLTDSPSDQFNFVVTAYNIQQPSFPTTVADITAVFNTFDVVIFFKHWSTYVTPNLQNAIISYADNGGGVLALHHAIYNDIDGSLNKNILRDQLFSVSSEMSGWSANRTNYSIFSTNYGHFISTYQVNYNQSYDPAPNAWNVNALPMAANSNYSTFPTFSIFDEVYNNSSFIPTTQFGRGVNQVTPLFSNNLSPGGQSHTTGFIRLFNVTGSDVGRFACFQPGERKETFSKSHPMGQVIRNAVYWASLN